MEFLGTTLENIEDIAQKEVKELINQEASIILPGLLKFEAEEQEVINLIHHSRSCQKFYKLLHKIEFKDFENLKEKLFKIEFNFVQEPFVVRVEKKDNEDFKSLTLEKDLGELIHDSFNKEVSLKEPKTILCLIIRENTCFLTIDYTKEKLSKRDYRLQLNVHSINPLISYFLLRFSDWKPGESILDPFINTGDIVIEAGLFALNIPPNKEIKFQYEQFTELKPKEGILDKELEIHGLDVNEYNVKKALFNATLVNIQDKLKLKKGEIDWLDSEFKEGEIKRIVTYPPYTSKTYPNEKIKEMYKELFHQADYILDNEGSVTILHPANENVYDYLKGSNFKLEKSRKMEINNRICIASVFKKVYKSE